MTDGEVGRGGASAFKRAQLRYRRQSTSSNDLDDVCDFGNPNEDERINQITIKSSSGELYDGPLYKIQGFSGFLYAPQALAPCWQKELSYLAVSEYCEKPHATNIDNLPPKPTEENNTDESMWELWKRENDDGVHGNNKSTKLMKKYRSFKKLSWATTGYHYDWTSRRYHEGAKSEMPELLSQLATRFAKTSLHLENAASMTFTASASIVNFYTVKSIMGGHRDDLELALDKPVISLSMGMAAIFLLGGKTKDDTPIIPILVRSGDVMILGGDCRLNYHGMARTIPVPFNFPVVPRLTTSLTFRGTSVVPESDEEPLAVFLRTHRININVRQVLPDGVESMIPDHSQASLS